MLILISTILGLSFWGSAFAAEAPNPPRAGTWEARGTYSYFSTEQNYSSTDTNVLVGDGSFTHMMGEGLVTYDWQPDWRFSAGMNFGWSESDDGSFTRTNSGVNELLFSAQKWYESGPFDIAPQGDFVYPLWRVDEADDNVLIGEGAMRIRGGAWAFWPRDTYKPFAYLGFEYRDGGRSYLLPYSVGVKLKLNEAWAQAEFRGYESIVDDADSDNFAVRQTYLTRVDAGSFKFYSINPSGSEINLSGGIQMGQFGVFGGFAISLSGNNSADGWTGYGGITYSPPDFTAAPKKNYDDGFEVKRERYDEGLFKEQREEEQPQFVEDPNFKEPARLPPEAPPERVSRPKKVDVQLELRKVKPKKKKKRPARRSKNIDNMMNEAESALEGSR